MTTFEPACRLLRGLLLTLAILAIPSVAAAADIMVDDDQDDTLANLDADGNCSLREAIQNANDDDDQFTDCDGGSGADTIKFDGVSSLTLTDEIAVNTDILIQGTVTLSGGNSTRLFVVGSSN